MLRLTALFLSVLALSSALALSARAQTATPDTDLPRRHHARHGAHKAAKPPAPPPPAAAAPATPEAPKPDPNKGSVSGQPLPRFAAFKSDDVNMRTGPGARYPIKWVYHHRDMPVEIEREFDVWRLVSDQEGEKGWVQVAMLNSHRGFAIVGKDDRTLRAAADDTSPAVAVLKPGVMGHIRLCEATAEWCEVQVGDLRGYLRRSDFWGSYPNEAIGD